MPGVKVRTAPNAVSFHLPARVAIFGAADQRSASPDADWRSSKMLSSREQKLRCPVDVAGRPWKPPDFAEALASQMWNPVNLSDQVIQSSKPALEYVLSESARLILAAFCRKG